MILFYIIAFIIGIFFIIRDEIKKKRCRKENAERWRVKQEELQKHQEKQLQEYYMSDYYKCTGLSLQQVYADDGKRGEFQIYRRLKYLERDGAKFLFNVYIPKKDGTTTEIDTLMICKKGVVVFESKNYGGWIFGDEDSKNWCQVLPDHGYRSQKFHFYNPVKQNASHIYHLSNYIGKNVPMHSMIVFADGCEFKFNKNEIKSAIVDYYCNLVPVWRNRIECNPDCLSEERCQAIYDKLLPCVQVDETTKRQHVEDIKRYK